MFELRTLTDGGDGGDGISVSNLNFGSVENISGRSAAVVDMKADIIGNVYVLYRQLVQADSALQSRLMKVDPSGSVTGTFDIGTYLLGAEHSIAGGDSAVAMAIDEFGQVFVAGSTNGNFPVTPNSFQQPQSLFSCSQDGFLMQVDTTLPVRYPLRFRARRLRLRHRSWHRTRPARFSLSAAGVLTDFPIWRLDSPYSRSPNLDQNAGDGFVAKFDLSQPGPDQLIAGTFLNVPLLGSQFSRENIHQLAVLPGGEIAVAGTTYPNELSLVNSVFNAQGSQASILPFVMLFSADAETVADVDHARQQRSGCQPGRCR